MDGEYCAWMRSEGGREREEGRERGIEECVRGVLLLSICLFESVYVCLYVSVSV